MTLVFKSDFSASGKTVFTGQNPTTGHLYYWLMNELNVSNCLVASTAAKQLVWNGISG